MNFVRRGFVALPDPVKAGVVAVVVWVVSFLFANLVALVPFLAFLAQYIPQIAIVVAGLVVSQIEKLLPTGYPEISIKAVELVLMILGVLGVGLKLAAQGALPALLGF